MIREITKKWAVRQDKQDCKFLVSEVVNILSCNTSGMSAKQTSTDPFLVIDPKDPSWVVNFVTTSQVYGGTYQQFSVRKHAERNIEWRKVLHAVL